MKHLLFPILILAFSFSSFSQEDQKKWSIQAKLTPTLSFSNYTAGSDAPTLTFLADLSQKNAARRTHLTMGGSIQTSYWITNSLRVNSGLSYTAYGERYHTTFSDFAPTVLHVYTQKLHITNHYLGVPLSISAHFRNREKSSLYATLGCNFDFLIFKSEVLRTLLATHVDTSSTPQTQRSVELYDRQNLIDQGFYNGFSPSLSASFGVDLKINSKSQLRIGSHAQYMLRPYQASPIKHYFYNVGLDITYVFANW